MRAWLIATALLAACGGSAAPPATPSLPTSSPDARPEPHPDLTLPVRAIEVTGLPADRAAEARDRIVTQVGAVADRVQLRADAVAIFELGGIADVQIRARAVEGGVAIAFEVTPRPVIGAIRVEGVDRGAALFDPATHLYLAEGDVFDPRRVNEARAALATAYADEGYVFAEVTWAFDRDTLTVTVVEGTQVTIRSIGVRGVTALRKREVTALLAKQEVVVGGPYRRSWLADGLIYLNTAYFDRGYVDVRTGPIEESFDAEQKVVDLVVVVDEGAKYRLGTIAVTGDLAASEKNYLKAAGLKRSAVYNRSELQAAVYRVSAFHQGLGQAEPRVDPSTEVDADKHLIDVTFAIAK